MIRLIYRLVVFIMLWRVLDATTDIRRDLSHLIAAVATAQQREFELLKKIDVLEHAGLCREVPLAP